MVPNKSTAMNSLASHRSNKQTLSRFYVPILVLLWIEVNIVALSSTEDAMSSMNYHLDYKPAKLSLEQMLVGLRSTPPHTASEFLASIVSHYGVPIFRKLTPNSVDSDDNNVLTHPTNSPNDQLSLLRQYDQQVEDNRIAVWIPGRDGTNLKRPILPKPSSQRSRLQFSMQDIAESANCEPEIQTVSLEYLLRLNGTDSESVASFSSSFSTSVSDLFFPHCIRLPKCGGCCPSERLKCAPTLVHKQIVSIMHVRYSARERRFQFCGLKRLTVERHSKCACQCRQKPSDCLPEQRYLPDECRCVCPGYARAQCLVKQARAGVLRTFMNWNSARCRCECRPPGGVWRCSTGHRFSLATCRCELDPHFSLTKLGPRQPSGQQLHSLPPTTTTTPLPNLTTRWPQSTTTIHHL